MVKLEDIQNQRIVDLVNILKSENISKYWIKDILLAKKFQASSFSREWSEPEFFIDCVWDNLSDEQKKKTVEELNVLIEEDIFSEKVYENNYCFILLELTVLLSKKNPGELNVRPFQLWKEKNYPNLSQPIDHKHYVIKNLDRTIDDLITNK